MQNSVWKLVVYITTAKFYKDTLNEKSLKELVDILRSDNSQYQQFFSFLQKRAISSSSQTRFLTLHLANYFFTRSAHFRSVVCHSYVYGFLVNFYTDLPPPEAFVEKIHLTFPLILKIWCDDYKNFYPQLVSLKSQFPLVQEELNETQKRIKANAELLYKNYKKTYDPLLKEVFNLSELLTPPKDNEYELTDEYVSTVTEELKSYKKPIEKCVSEINWLQTITKKSQKGTEIGNDIEELYKRAKRALDLFSIYADDEFEDVDDSE